jgi:threonine/homoserine/homoserine lactone efflux protein
VPTSQPTSSREPAATISAGLQLELRLLLAWSVPAVGLLYLLTLANGMHYARATLTRRRVRRAFDGATGVVLLGFAATLAADSA